MTSAPIERGNLGADMYTRGEGHVNMKAEGRVTFLQAKGH